LEPVQRPQQVNNTPNQEDHVSYVQNHVLIKEHQLLDSVDYVSKVKQQRSQEDPLLKKKNHVSKIETKDLDGKRKHDTTHVLEIDPKHVSKEKKKHDTYHVSKVHQKHLHENPYISLQLKHLVLQTNHVFEVKVPMLTIQYNVEFLSS
jgi:hypothetical protein